MSAEFLTILKKETPPSTKESSTKIISGDKEKKEGNSLFDSLMNEAKKETLKNKEKNSVNGDKINAEFSQKTESKTESKVESKTESKTESKESKESKVEFKTESKESKTESKTESKIESKAENKEIGLKLNNHKSVVNTSEVEAKIKSLLSNNESAKDPIVESKSSDTVKIKVDNSIEEELTEIKNTNSKDTKIINNTAANIEGKNSSSLKKMVEKLVNIVVNAAKEIFDKSSRNELNTTEITAKVEKIVDNKIQTLENSDKIKVLISQKIDIVKNSVDTIKKEIKSISTESEVAKNTIKSEVETAKNAIKSEVAIIKETVQGIQKEISVIDLEKKETPKDIQKEISVNDLEKKETPKDIQKEISVNDLEKKETSKDIQKSTSKLDNDNHSKNHLKEEVVENLIVIDNNADEIKNFISASDDSVKEIRNIQSTVSNVEKKVQVIKDVISDIKEKISEVIIVKTTGKEEKKEITVNTTKVSESLSNLDENNKERPLLATMFLNAQKKAKTTTSLEQLKDAKNNIVEKKTIEAVKVSAEKLELDIEETEVKHEEQEGKKPISEEKKQELKTNSFITNRLLNKAIINQRAGEIQLNKEKNILATNNEISISKSADTIKEESVELIVPRDIVQNLQHKIIGAQQKMGTFMNDVARSMYLNYKPPVTAFRVNLNPANLGSISIIMKANKIDNSLSVSMNLSNSNTMEAFTENKVALQSAIQRQFNDGSNVSINFNMQNQNSDSQFNQSNQENKQNNQNTNSNEKESLANEEQEIVETNDYM